MREFRITGVAVSSVILAGVVAFVLAYLAGQSPKPAPPSHQASASKDAVPGQPKNSARVLTPTTLNYFRVNVALDGTLRTDKHTFHLYGANIPGREYTCTYHNGQRWACGLRAYVALLNIVGSAPIECRPKDALKPEVVICHNGNIDLSEWMLKNGWARLQKGVTDERYVEAARAASTAKIGMWLEAPETQQNATPQ